MISIIVTLACLGFGLWLVSLIPMPAWAKQVIMGVAVLFVVLWLLSIFGLFKLPVGLR
jgi:hypothetical protein